MSKASRIEKRTRADVVIEKGNGRKNKMFVDSGEKKMLEEEKQSAR